MMHHDHSHELQAPAFGAAQTGSAFGGGFGQPAAAATPLGGT